jgi:hypothetical protein
VRSQVFTPNYDHHIEPAEARSLPLWMDVQLRGQPAAWPATPQIDVPNSSDDGVPMVRIVPADIQHVDRVDIYYSLSNDGPMTRFWRTVKKVRREEEAFVGAAPFVESGDVVTAYANVTYASGIRLSSRLARRLVADVVGARPTLAKQALVDPMDTSTDWNWVPAYTDPNQGETAFFAPWQGAGGERGFTLDPKMFNRAQPMSFYSGTRKIGDPQFRGAGDAVLAIDYLAGSSPERLTIRLKHRLPGEYGQEFEAAALPPAEGEAAANATGDVLWRTLRLDRSQFHNAQGTVLPDWEHVENFMLQGTSPAMHPPVFKCLRWEK